MASRYGSLAVYSLLVAAVASVWLVFDLMSVPHLPGLGGGAVLCIVLQPPALALRSRYSSRS